MANKMEMIKEMLKGRKNYDVECRKVYRCISLKQVQNAYKRFTEGQKDAGWSFLAILGGRIG